MKSHIYARVVSLHFYVDSYVRPAFDRTLAIFVTFSNFWSLVVHRQLCMDAPPSPTLCVITVKETDLLDIPSHYFDFDTETLKRFLDQKHFIHDNTSIKYFLNIKKHFILAVYTIQNCFFF